jgi:hypothetical protein
LTTTILLNALIRFDARLPPRTPAAQSGSTQYNNAAPYARHGQRRQATANQAFSLNQKTQPPSNSTGSIQAYLRSVITHINEQPIKRVDALLPWRVANDLRCASMPVTHALA